MIEGIFQPMHLILILTIVLIIFGPGKLPEVGKSLGGAVKDFKRAMNDGTGEVRATAQAEHRFDSPSASRQAALLDEKKSNHGIEP